MLSKIQVVIRKSSGILGRRFEKLQKNLHVLKTFPKLANTKKPRQRLSINLF